MKPTLLTLLTLCALAIGCRTNPPKQTVQPKPRTFSASVVAPSAATNASGASVRLFTEVIENKGVEVSHPSAPGFYYQLEATTNMVDWAVCTSPELARTDPMVWKLYDRRLQDTVRAFRVIKIGFDQLTTPYSEVIPVPEP